MDNANPMPQSWIQTTLGDISLINPKLDLVDFSDDLEISFIPMAAVETESGKVDLSQTRKLGSVKKGYTPFIDGDVIFAKITPCMENGKIAFLNGLKEGIGFGSTEFHVSRPLNNVPRKFIFYFLVQRSYRKDAQGNMTGSAGQLRVPTNFFRDSLIPLPPLREQHRIVAKIEELFSKLDKGVEALKTARQQLKVYRQAVLKWAFEGKLTEEWRKQQKNLPVATQLLEQIKTEREKLAKDNGKKLKPVTPLTAAEAAELPGLPDGWTWIKAGQLYNFVTSGSRGWAQYYSESGAIFIRITNLDFDSVKLDLDPSKLQYVMPPEGAEGLRTRVTEGDLLFSITGYLGMFAIAPKLEEAYINQHIALCRPVDGFNKLYMGFWAISKTGGNHYLNQMQKGATKAGLGLDDIQNLIVPFCALGEQNQIVQEIEIRLSVADKLEETISQSLQKAEALRQSILKKAFEGKLVPQDPNDEPASKLLERIKAEKAAQGPVKRSTIHTT